MIFHGKVTVSPERVWRFGGVCFQGSEPLCLILAKAAWGGCWKQGYEKQNKVMNDYNILTLAGLKFSDMAKTSGKYNDSNIELNFSSALYFLKASWPVYLGPSELRLHILIFSFQNESPENLQMLPGPFRRGIKSEFLRAESGPWCFCFPISLGESMYRQGCRPLCLIWISYQIGEKGWEGGQFIPGHTAD